MAIVNRTPDSFYDRGATFELDAAVQAGVRAFEHGADLLDVGGVKFAPGPPLPVDEEADRVVPFVRELAPHGPVSVDTFHPEVARRAIEAGAAVVNDTTGLHDPAMADIVADSDALLIIAHSVAKPRTRLVGPVYEDIVAEVREFLESRVELALARGVRPEQIIVDPGHDLNKNTLHSLEITRRLEEFANMGYPLLVALSNKDFIGESLHRERSERLSGSLSSAVWCATQGARIVRVHNVPETVDAIHMFEAIQGWRRPAYLRHNMPVLGAEARPEPAQPQSVNSEVSV
ncbi:dihydropteroate synthase [Leucobacter denitrificans]|uniref:Dihydropteroate synthase n=2 Tax=Leucobacter denitrificans TaxID=683042 RepID=A0A7G9S7Z5_9MICO|nr:dihydropteroate synthase [Leucobacter denitrificans]